MSHSLEYIVRQPKSDHKTPALLVLLHGYGSNEHDLFSFADELPDNLLIVSVRAPYDMGFGGYAWYAINFDADENKFSDLTQARESVDRIANLITQLKKDYNTHPDKTFLLGFSQGAILSYALSFLYPNSVQHVIALSGYLNRELLPEHVSSELNTDYYISHGTVDQVIPVDWARKAAPFLTSSGLQAEYSEYPVGHGVAPQNFFSFKDWIEKRLNF